MDELRAGDADHREQECREPRQRIATSSENTKVRPGIEIMLHRQEKDLRRSATSPQLGTIGVLFPAHAAEQRSIDGTKRDEIAAAAMVWAEHELLRLQLSESVFDVGRAKLRTIPPDGDNFVIPKLRDSFDRVLKARREIPARLPVNVRSDDDRFSGRREKVKINLRRNLGAQARYTKKRPRHPRERTSRQVDVNFVGKYENSSSGHAFGYETATVADKHF